MTYSPGKCCKIIIACFILHNMCVKANIPVDEDEDGDENEDEGSDGEDGDNHARVNFGGVAQGDGWQVRQNLANTRFMA
jgi:hypothetical protein